MSAYIPLTSAFLLTTLVLSSSSAPTNTSLTNHDLEIAIEEMKRANYFTFVMLIHMVLPDSIKPKITFLMPNDRTLAKTLFPENNISDFLLRHSIPSPLLFDHLVHIPTGSMIPTSKPEHMLEISNNGRRSFYLSNVRLISPNLCTHGHSIRCHGIDGVIEPFSSPTCSNNSSSSTAPPPVAAPPVPPASGRIWRPPLAAPSVPPASGGIWQPPLAAPPVAVSGGTKTRPDTPLPPYHHDDPKKSGSSRGSGLRRFWPVLLGLVIGLAMGLYTSNYLVI